MGRPGRHADHTYIVSDATIDPADPADDLPPWPLPAYPSFGPDVWGPVRTNGYAIAASLFGLAGLPLYRFPVAAILGVTFGGIALSQTRRSGERGRWVAVAGMVLGIVGLAASAVALAHGVNHLVGVRV